MFASIKSIEPLVIDFFFVIHKKKKKKITSYFDRGSLDSGWFSIFRSPVTNLVYFVPSKLVTCMFIVIDMASVQWSKR